jgi:hypothetical protein
MGLAIFWAIFGRFSGDFRAIFGRSTHLVTLNTSSIKILFYNTTVNVLSFAFHEL